MLSANELQLWVENTPESFNSSLLCVAKQMKDLWIFQRELQHGNKLRYMERSSISENC
jgi:hypothetical protein